MKQWIKQWLVDKQVEFCESFMNIHINHDKGLRRFVLL